MLRSLRSIELACDTLRRTVCSPQKRRCIVNGSQFSTEYLPQVLRKSNAQLVSGAALVERPSSDAFEREGKKKKEEEERRTTVQVVVEICVSVLWTVSVQVVVIVVSDPGFVSVTVT